RLAVLAEALAVIAGDGDNRRPIARLARAQTREQLADDRVVVRDLAVVGPAGERGRERRRRIVGVVWIVEVQPREKRPPVGRGLVEPALHRRCGVAAATFELEAIVVAVEAAREPVAPIED